MALPDADLTKSTVSDTINRFNFTQLVADRFLSIFRNYMVVSGHFRKQEGMLFNGDIGDSVQIQRRLQFNVSDGRVASPQRIEEGKWPITIDQRKHIAVNVTSQDKTLFMPTWMRDVLDPQTMILANYVDRQACEMYKHAYHYVDYTGDTNGTPSTRGSLAKAIDTLCELGVSKMNLRGFLTLRSLTEVQNSTQTLDAPKLVTDTYGSHAAQFSVAGIDWYSSQNIAQHTVGAEADNTTIRINGANQYHAISGTTSSNDQDEFEIDLDGLTASTSNALYQGDIIKIAGVKKVNMVAGENGKKTVLSDDMPFTVVSTGNDSDGSGELTIKIRPTPIIEGPYQNVSAAPADNAVVSVVGDAGDTRYEGLLFNPNAFALPMKMLAPIGEGGGGVRTSSRQGDGIGVRVGMYADGANDVEAVRCDILYGLDRLDGNNAVRLLVTK